MIIDVKFEEKDANIDVKFEEKNAIFDVSFGESINIGSGETYNGDYNFTPTIVGGILNTAHKMMKEDVVINPIPTYEVSNVFGGTTFYIAKE